MAGESLVESSVPRGQSYGGTEDSTRDSIAALNELLKTLYSSKVSELSCGSLVAPSQPLQSPSFTTSLKRDCSLLAHVSLAGVPLMSLPAHFLSSFSSLRLSVLLSRHALDKTPAA